MSLKKLLSSKISAVLAATLVVSGLSAISATPAQAALNPASEMIFFDQGAGHTGIKRMRFDGTGKSTYNISSLITTPDIRTMTSDGQKLYFVNNGDGVYSMNLDGTSLTKILAASPSDIVVYGTKIYYTLWSGGVSSMNLDGTGATSLAAASTFPGASSTGIRNLYVDGTYIWVTHGTGGGGTDGHLYRLAIAGGTPSLAYTDVGTAGINGVAGSGNDIFIRSGNGKILGLSRSALIAGTQTAPTSELYNNNQGSSVEFAGGKIYANTNAEVFEMDLASYNQASPAVLTATALNLNSAFTAANPGTMVIFAAKTIQYDANGGAGSMTAQSSAFTLTLTSNSFTRTNHVFAYWYTNNTCSTGGSILNDGASYAPDASGTLYACWRGAVEISLSASGPSIDTYDFGTVVTGSTNTVTLYLRNVGDVSARSLSFSNASVSSGVGLSYGAGTCSFSGGNLVVGTPCTTVITWNPVSAQTLSTSTHGFTAQAAAFYNVSFSGAAVTNRIVTFDSNTGTGAMTAQSAVSAQSLTANNFSKTGYTFAGWNTQADGLGASYADGATYLFANSLTLYAKWAAIPVPAGATAPLLTGTSAKVFTEGNGQTVTIEGRRLDDLLTALVGGVEVKVLSNSSNAIQLDLGSLTPGVYSITLRFKAGSVTYQDAITIKPKASEATSPTAHQALSVLVPGFIGDSAVLTNQLKTKIIAALARLPKANVLVCIGSTSSKSVTTNDRNLAKARAKAACAFAKRNLGGLKTSIVLNPASGVTPAARNVLLQLSF
ncbi:MAG: InlB B-repeat-containing protein [Rhodoluna sp.]